MAVVERPLVSTALHPTRRRIENAEAAGLDFAGDDIPIIDQDGTGEDGHLTYPEYLQTPEWREYREGVLKQRNGKCTTCERDATHAHHRTYLHIGWEADEDCVGLCPDCHKKMHGRRARRRR